jgi:predicted transcriptional regulator
LKVLWDRGTATIREITDILYPEGDTSHYATVQKLLDRLQERGCVARERHARVNVYRAKIDRDDLIREQLQDAADKLCAGSMTPLLTQLVDARQLTPQDIRTLRALVERLGREGE